MKRPKSEIKQHKKLDKQIEDEVDLDISSDEANPQQNLVKK